MLTAFSVLMTIIVMLEIGVAIVTFVYKSKVKELAAQNLENAVQNYDSDIDVSFFDMAQQQITFQCCGKSGPADYRMRPNGIPGTCCNKSDSQSCLASEAFTKGCNDDVQMKLDKALLSVALSALGMACGHILTIVFACYYTRSRKQRDEKKGECEAPQPQQQQQQKDDSDCCFYACLGLCCCCCC